MFLLFFDKTPPKSLSYLSRGDTSLPSDSPTAPKRLGSDTAWELHIYAQKLVSSQQTNSFFAFSSNRA